MAPSGQVLGGLDDGHPPTHGQLSVCLLPVALADGVGRGPVVTRHLLVKGLARHALGHQLGHGPDERVAAFDVVVQEAERPIRHAGVDAQRDLAQLRGHRVPGQLVLDDLSCGVLQVDSLRDGVRGDQDAHRRPLESMKHLATLSLVQRAMDGEHGGIAVVLVPGDVFLKVFQRIHVAGEDDHLGVPRKGLAQGTVQQLLQLAVATWSHSLGDIQRTLQFVDLGADQLRRPKDAALRPLSGLLVVHALAGVLVQDVGPSHVGWERDILLSRELAFQMSKQAGPTIAQGAAQRLGTDVDIRWGSYWLETTLINLSMSI